LAGAGCGFFPVFCGVERRVVLPVEDLREAAVFFCVVRLEVFFFFPAALFCCVFFDVDFLEAAFWPDGFFEADVFGVAFFEAGFFEADVFEADFFAAVFPFFVWEALFFAIWALPIFFRTLFTRQSKKAQHIVPCHAFSQPKQRFYPKLSVLIF